MTLNCNGSRSQNFNVRINYLECRERYSVRHNGGHVGNHQWAPSGTVTFDLG